MTGQNGQKWTTLNTAIIGFLPVGSTWRQTKRFCLTTFDKYAHAKNRAKGNGKEECELCGRRDSLMHILGECHHPELCSIREEAHNAVTALVASWQLGEHSHRPERDMWQRYSSNILVPTEYTEECWLGVYSDASLQWLFGPEFITAQLSINNNAQMPLMKRVIDSDVFLRKSTTAIIIHPPE
jgi:hypothetical protein